MGLAKRTDVGFRDNGKTIEPMLLLLIALTLTTLVAIFVCEVTERMALREAHAKEQWEALANSPEVQEFCKKLGAAARAAAQPAHFEHCEFINIDEEGVYLYTLSGLGDQD